MDKNKLLKAIQSLPNKQYVSDPRPTWLLKKGFRNDFSFCKKYGQSVFSEGIVPNRLRLHHC